MYDVIISIPPPLRRARMKLTTVVVIGTEVHVDVNSNTSRLQQVEGYIRDIR